MNPISRTQTQYLSKLSPNVLKTKYPLTHVDTKLLEGVQKGIPLFDGVKLKDIAFITKFLETLNLFRGCTVACSHCLKDSKSPQRGNESILYEDLERFTEGFKELNERLGFNVLEGNEYLNIIDDANPSDLPIKGLIRDHNVVEGMKLIYDKLKIPTLFVTSGWNKGSKYAQKAMEEVAKMVTSKPESVIDIQISMNPFSGLMEASRKALKENNQANADFFREAFTTRMANTFATFLKQFEDGKASIIYRHALPYKGNELVGEAETARLYSEIYEKLGKIVGSKIENIPQLKPEVVTAFDQSHLIEPSGRGRQFFPFERNMQEQSELINEALSWNALSKDEQYKALQDYAVKCVDINGRIYTTKPANETENVFSPIELTIPTDIRLNYINQKETPNVFSDIEV